MLKIRLSDVLPTRIISFIYVSFSPSKPLYYYSSSPVRLEDYGLVKLDLESSSQFGHLRRDLKLFSYG